MHQAKYIKKSLTHSKLAMRAFFLSILLMGNTFIFISAIASSQTFAHGATQVKQQHVTRLQPHAVVSTKKGLQAEKNTVPQGQKEQADRQSARLNSRRETGAQPVATPVPQDVNITSNVQGGPAFQVGQTLQFQLIVLNVSSSTTLDATSNVSVYNLIPLGLTNITATGSGWNVTSTNATSPTSVASIYTGPPVAPGGVFAPISVSGTLTNGAVPVFTNTAAVSDNTNPNTNLTTFSVSVSPSTQTVTATTTPTPTTTPIPTTIPTPTTGLVMSFNVHGGPTYQVGQTLTFDLIVTNNTTTTIDAASTAGLGNLVPAGLDNIVTTGSAWTVTSTAPSGPFVIRATYSGPPVLPGANLPPLEISGTLTSDASPTFTNTAGVADTLNPVANIASFSINVSPATATVLPSPTISTTPVTGSLDMNFNVHGGPTYQVGQTLTFDLIVTNNTTTTIDAASTAGLGNLVPAGLDNIVTTGSAWTVTSTAPSGPFVIRATYSGPPVLPGANLPPLEISGTLTSDASPTFTNTAGVADTLNPVANIASFSINVSPATATVVVSPTVVISPTVISPSPTVVISPTVISPSPTATPPQLSIVSSSPGGNTSAVGQTVNYQLVVTNLPTSLAKNQPISVQDVFPVGLTNMAATGNNWNIVLSSTTSPTLITATYMGPYPVAPGSILPAISISGTLTAAADSSFTSSASVSSAEDPNPNPTLNTSTQTITVLGSTASPTTTATATPTLPATPSSSPTTVVPPTLPTSGTTAIPGTPPNVSIVQSHLGGDHFHVGDTVTYVLIVSKALANEALVSPITVTDVMPLGLSHLKVVAPGWLVSISNASSPAVITATYNGLAPTSSALVLSPIIITGILNKDADPSFTNSATVDMLGNSNVYNTTSIDSIFVNGNDNQNNNNDQNNNNQNNNNDNHQNNDNNHQNNNNQNNNNHQNNNNNHQNNNNNSNSSNNASFPGLPATGSDPAGA